MIARGKGRHGRPPSDRFPACLDPSSNVVIGPELAKLSWAAILTAVLGTFPKTMRGNRCGGEFWLRTGFKTKEGASTEGFSAPERPSNGGP